MTEQATLSCSERDDKLKEIAGLLDGRQYHDELTDGIETVAKENGIVIVHGLSDDLVEYDGAWNDESDHYGGGIDYVMPDGVFQKPENCECDYPDKCPLLDAEINKCAKIYSIWNGCWSYETEIPHETFMIYEGAELYCRGIVFYAADAFVHGG